MIDITCEMCMDLMPLVRDGIASEDSCKAVHQHIQKCPECKALFEGELPPPSDGEGLVERIKRRVQIFSAMVLMFGIFFGLSLTASNELFYNSLIMPLIGAVGYYIFRWKALYTVPVLLFGTHLITNTFGLIRGVEHLDFATLLMWTVLYCIFAFLGMVAASLIHLFLMKTGKMKKGMKVLALAAGLALIIGLGWFANSLVGNPLSKYLAKRTAEEYLAENFGDTDYYIERVTYSFKDGRYHAFVASPSSVDSYFSLMIEMTGELRYDTYDSVTEKSNTARRLDQEYRALTDSVIESAAFPYNNNIAYGRLEIYPQELIGNPNVTDIPDYAMIQEELVIDKVYDIRQLAAQAGHLIVFVDNDTVTVERAAQIMLDIRRFMDDAGIPFCAMDFCLQYPRPEEGVRPDGSIHVLDFRYEDIYEDGMVERVKRAEEATRVYYEALDNGK